MTLPSVERHAILTAQCLELIKQNLVKCNLKCFVTHRQHDKASSVDSPVHLIVTTKKEATVAVPRIIKVMNIYPLGSFSFGTANVHMTIHFQVNMHQIFTEISSFPLAYVREGIYIKNHFTPSAETIVCSNFIKKKIPILLFATQKDIRTEYSHF